MAPLFSLPKNPHPLLPALEADRYMMSPQGQATWASRGCGVEGSWARCGGLEQAGDACSVQRHRVTVARCPPGTENGWLPALPIIKGKSVNRISVGVDSSRFSMFTAVHFLIFFKIPRGPDKDV